ncbi:hypothetical protein Bbelb_415940 [Branchiostoma belcheri]|nr:hypothetical protein Bbelb_415940 [Branchiostoma belcheri]
MARRLSARRESFTYMRRLSAKIWAAALPTRRNRDRPVRRCPALVTSSLATGEDVGRARHGCRWRRRPDFMRLADAPGLGYFMARSQTSRLWLSSSRVQCLTAVLSNRKVYTSDLGSDAGTVQSKPVNTTEQLDDMDD